MFAHVSFLSHARVWRTPVCYVNWRSPFGSQALLRFQSRVSSCTGQHDTLYSVLLLFPQNLSFLTWRQVKRWIPPAHCRRTRR